MIRRAIDLGVALYRREDRARDRVAGCLVCLDVRGAVVAAVDALGCAVGWRVLFRAADLAITVTRAVEL